MKLKKGYITHTIQGTQVMVAAGPAASKFNGLVRSNETAAFIIDCLKHDTSRENIINSLTDTYEVDTTTAQNDVAYILEQLNQIGALEI